MLRHSSNTISTDLGANMAFNPWGPQHPQQPSNPAYPGGAAGVQNDLGIKNKFVDVSLQAYLGNLQNQWNSQNQWNGQLSGGAGLVTGAQVGAAKGDLQQPLADWGNLKTNGWWTPQEQAQQITNQQQLLQRQSDAAQKNFNATASSHGLGGNAGALAALGSQGMWEAAGQKGFLENQISAQQAQSKERGIQGYSGVSSQLANIDMSPTQENYLAFLNANKQSGAGSAPGVNDLDAAYKHWMDQQTGPSGFNWNNVQQPTAPSYPTWPSYPGGGGGGGNGPTYWRRV